MPIDALRKIAIEQTDKPFGRLAFRCAMTAELAGNALKTGVDHTFALHATRYRKLKRQLDNLNIVEVCGHDDGDSGAGAHVGDGQGYDDVTLALARRCRNYVLPQGTSATVALNFSWRRKAGDITGMFQMIVTPTPSGTPIEVLSGDTEATGANDAGFADFFQSLLSAIKSKTDVSGW